jgi:hypothetical protein
LATGFYLFFTAAAFVLHGADARWFLWIGDRFATGNPQGRIGYDGQFVYYIALDGLAAAPRLDNPAYRLTRIGLPLAARLLASGSAELVPWAILAINLAAIVGTTWILARWLASNGAPASLGLLYPFYLGTFLAFSRALTEPLAFFLAAAGTVGWLRERRSPALVLLALAALTKEITVLFTAGLAVAALARGRFRDAAVLLATTLPLLLWWGFLQWHFAVAGQGFPQSVLPTLIPLAGALAARTLDVGYLSALVAVALPAILLFPLSIMRLRNNWSDALAWLLLVNSSWTLLLPAKVYEHVMSAGRNATGLVVALLLVLPLRNGKEPLTVAALWTIPTLVWLPPVLLWSPWGPPLRELLRAWLG